MGDDQHVGNHQDMWFLAKPPLRLWSSHFPITWVPCIHRCHLRLLHLGRKNLLQDTVSCGRFARILPRPCWKTSGRGPPAEGSPRSGRQVSFHRMVQTGVFQVGKETVGPSQDMMWMKNHGPDQMLILFSNQILCYEALLGGASHLKEW